MEVGFEGGLDMLMLCACCLLLCTLKHTHTHTHTRAHTKKEGEYSFNLTSINKTQHNRLFFRFSDFLHVFVFPFYTKARVTFANHIISSNSLIYVDIK